MTLTPYAVSAYHNEGTDSSCKARLIIWASVVTNGPLMRVAAFSHSCAKAFNNTPHNNTLKSASFMSGSPQPCGYPPR